ncbi:MAG: CRISPR system precrRNA processing endoribonuclease RAMP protein Cas6 [Syntrophales bacterium]|nr:CRISPR system precrRNA processing endoribonuclease RAMP protein Cas6 [Syntrophales bacterium]
MNVCKFQLHIEARQPIILPPYKGSTLRGGFVGSITYEGNMLPFLTPLKAGETLHVGKGTTFGLGKYEMRL